MIKDAAVSATVALEDKEVAAAIPEEIDLTIAAPIRMANEKIPKPQRLPVAWPTSKQNLAAIQEVASGLAKKVSHRIKLSLPTGKPDTAKI